MATLIKIVIFLASNWQSIYELIKAISGILKQTDDPVAAKQVTKELAEATKEFKATKDKRPLEKLLCKVRGNCDL